MAEEKENYGTNALAAAVYLFVGILLGILLKTLIGPDCNLMQGRPADFNQQYGLRVILADENGRMFKSEYNLKWIPKVAELENMRIMFYQKGDTLCAELDPPTTEPLPPDPISKPPETDDK